jgi:hypothetical protein
MWLIPLAEAADAAALTADIDPAELERTIRALSNVDAVDGRPIASRSVHHPDLARAATWLGDELAAAGLAVRTEPFEVTGQGDVDPTYNLIAEIPGADAGPWILLGAHYDSTASLDAEWDPATDPAPGADDDAAGVAAALEIARRCAAYPPGFRKPIRFVLFSAEEVGLQGSYVHAASLDVEIEAMLQLDPIGYNPGADGTLWHTYDEGSGDLSEEFLAFSASYSGNLVLNRIDEDLIGGDARSDHFPFWEVGVPALHFGSFPLAPTYHTMDDTIAVVDPVYARDVAALVGAWVAHLAEPLDPPEVGGGCGCRSGGSSGWAALAAASLSFRCRRVRPTNRAS